jgi:hypothetical protein
MFQMLLKLPGFHFTESNNVFGSREGAHLKAILKAQYATGGNHRILPARNQGPVCVCVAEVLEVCCDEWYDNWGNERMTSKFWDAAADRLRYYNKHWTAFWPTPLQVNTICLAYTRHWDEDGRGPGVTDDDAASWGFNRWELTWGEQKANIDPDIFAQPWEYERACRLPILRLLAYG